MFFMDEKKQQELFYKISIFEQQMRQLQQQLEAVEQGIVDLESLKFGLDELVGKKDQEVFSSLGKGIFAKTKLVSEDLLMNIGDRKFVSKSIPETKKSMDDQIKRLNEMKMDLNNSLNEINEEVGKIIDEANKEESSD